MHGKFVLIKYIGRDFFQALCHCIVLMFQTESVKDRKCGKFSIGSRGCCNPPPTPTPASGSSADSWWGASSQAPQAQCT